MKRQSFFSKNETKKKSIQKSILSLTDSPSLLVPIKKKNNQCYAISVIQLLQRVNQLWSIVIKRLETDGVTVNEVLLNKPLTFASILLGSQLREAFDTSTRQLLEPKPIDFDSFEVVKNKIFNKFSLPKQEDASEFLIELLGSYVSENSKDTKKFESTFMSYQTSKYQCQSCGSLLQDSATPYPLSHLSLETMKDNNADLSINSLVRKEFNDFNAMDSLNYPSCSKCEKKTFHKQCCDISKLPLFLLFNVKRYKKDSNQQSVYDKIKCNIKCDKTIMIPEHKWDTEGNFCFCLYPISLEIYFIC